MDTMEPESNEDEPLTYRITHPFKFSSDGDLIKCEFVTLKPPTSRQSKHAGFLRQCFMQALREQMNNDKVMAAAERAREVMDNQDPQDPEDETTEDDPTAGHSVVNMVAMAEKVDYTKFLDQGKKLLGSGVMFFNGGTAAKENPIEKMGLWDLEEILGRYIANFINTSPS